MQVFCFCPPWPSAFYEIINFQTRQFWKNRLGPQLLQISEIVSVRPHPPIMALHSLSSIYFTSCWTSLLFFPLSCDSAHTCEVRVIPGPFLTGCSCSKCSLLTDHPATLNSTSSNHCGPELRGEHRLSNCCTLTLLQGCRGKPDKPSAGWWSCWALQWLLLQSATCTFDSGSQLEADHGVPSPSFCTGLTCCGVKKFILTWGYLLFL